MSMRANLARGGVNALGRQSDSVRNRRVADILLRAGPERDATIIQPSEALARRQGRQAVASDADRVVQSLLTTRQLERPGFMGLNYGHRTPLATLVGQAVYGLVLGGVPRFLAGLG